MNLTYFLLARIAEDEDQARTFLADNHAALVRAGLPFRHSAMSFVVRVFAECDAKRRIMELHAISVTTEWVNPSDGPAYQEPEWTCAICGWVPDACGTVKTLALPFADHPDYEPSWRP